MHITHLQAAAMKPAHAIPSRAVQTINAGLDSLGDVEGAPLYQQSKLQPPSF